MVEEICAGRKLDYFARKKRDGWDVYGDENTVHMVFEYMLSDLEVIIRNSQIFMSAGDVKAIILQVNKLFIIFPLNLSLIL